MQSLDLVIMLRRPQKRKLVTLRQLKSIGRQQTRIAYDNSIWHATKCRVHKLNQRKTFWRKNVPQWHIYIYPPFHIPSLLNTPLVKMIMNSQEHEQVLYTPYTDGKQQTVPIKLCPTLLTLSRGTIKLATGHSIGDSNCTVWSVNSLLYIYIFVHWASVLYKTFSRTGQAAVPQSQQTERKWNKYWQHIDVPRTAIAR